MIKRLLAFFFVVSIAAALAACNTNGGIPASPVGPPSQATPGGQPTPQPTPPSGADGHRHKPTHRSIHHIR